MASEPHPKNRHAVKLLDLFCGAGGAAVGYSRAGFTDIVGVDIKPQKNYPFTFILGDALEYLAEHGREFNVIHASPPCQGYSIMRNLPWLRHKEYPLLIQPTRVLVEATGREWVIENVMGARLPAGWLCGTMFGLPFFRHRYFEASRLLLMPTHERHHGIIRSSGARGSRARDVVFTRSKHPNGASRNWANVGHAAGVQAVRDAMGLNYMTQEEITQAVPPAYTEFIGRQLLAALG